MIKIIYHGNAVNPLIKLRGSGGTKKVLNGVPFEVSEVDWAFMQSSPEFSKVEEVKKIETKVETTKKKKKTKRGGK